MRSARDVKKCLDISNGRVSERATFIFIVHRSFLADLRPLRRRNFDSALTSLKSTLVMRFLNQMSDYKQQKYYSKFKFLASTCR